MKLAPALLITAILAVCAPAGAQVPAADALFDEGRAALARGDLETACARFRASDRLDPAAGTRMNVGDCEERRRHVASAWEAFRAAIELMPAGDARIRVAEERIARLRPRIPHLVLELREGPWDTTVRDGAETIGKRNTYGTPIPLDPGVHHLVVEAPGRVPVEIEVTLAEGQTTKLGIKPGPSDPAAPAPSPLPVAPAASATPPAPPVAPAAPPTLPAPPATPPPSSSGSAAGPWVVGGIGVVGIVVGAVAGGVVLQKKSIADAHCSDATHTCDADGQAASRTGRVLGPVSTVAFIVGGLGLAGGVTWLVLRDPAPRAQVSTGPRMLASGAMWSVEGTW